jgi:adenine-specific DNA-methyltransferase
MPSLTWIGKEAVQQLHRQIPYRLLRCDDTLSVAAPADGNLLVEGDNLHALKALLPYYAGKVKCIYIDPPYNTGNEGWVYNDAVNAPEMKAWLADALAGQPVKLDDLSRHDKWLCMMYPRLVLLRNLLRQDGVIVVAIDDNEFANLRLLLDEVFGESNWLGTLVWEKTRKNDARFFSIGHDYMLVYAHNMEHLRTIGTIWREPKPGAAEIFEEYNRLRSIYGDNNAAVEESLRKWYADLPDVHPSKKLSRYKHVDDRGVWRDRDISWPGGGGPRYEVIHPKTLQPCRIPERGWGFATPEAMQRQIDLDLVVFREDHTEPPMRKAHLFPSFAGDNDEDSDEDQDIGLQVMPSVIYRHTQPSVRFLRKMMGGKVFNNPKDHEVLARLFRYLTKPGDLILDSFAGSGSTAHAVLQLNHDDRGDRRFILVEMEPKIAREITAERLRRAVQGYTWTDERGKEHAEAGLSGGFRFCTLDEPLFDARGRIRWGVTFGELARHIFFTETGHPLAGPPEAEGPFIGAQDGISYFLLWNGTTAGDLDVAALRLLAKHDGRKVVYAALCRVADERLARAGIVYKQIPYSIRTS